MSRNVFGLLALSGMVLMLAGFSTQSRQAEAGFLFFGHGGGHNHCCVDYDDDDCDYDDDDCDYDDDDCDYDDDDCCRPVRCHPAPVCCHPAPTCCHPVPTCCGPAPAYENGGHGEGAAPAPPAEGAPAAEEAPAPKPEA